MIVLGLLVLLAASGLAISGITTRDHGAHSPARSGLLGYHLPGQGSLLFCFGLILAAAAMSGLARMAAGAWARGQTGPGLPATAAGTPGPLPATSAPAARRFGVTNRTLWSQTSPWPHRE